MCTYVCVCLEMLTGMSTAPKGHGADDLGVFRCGSSVTSFRSALTSDLRAQCVHCTLTDDPRSDHMTLLPVLRNVTLKSNTLHCF